jgi:uncharacterized protein YbjQ (UPF0145 family)
VEAVFERLGGRKVVKVLVVQTGQFLLGAVLTRNISKNKNLVFFGNIRIYKKNKFLDF